MAKPNPQLSWCIVRVGTDMNWWVVETSDPVHWDTDGLSILDPRQMAHIIELCEPLRDYGFDFDLLEQAFFTFRVDKEVDDGLVRLVRLRDNLVGNEEKLFAMPDVLNEDKGPYAELLDEMIKARVKLLNDVLSLEQPLTTDELEEALSERAGLDYSEGRALPAFTELNSILEYVPDGFEDEMGEVKSSKAAEVAADIPDVVEEENIEQDETMRWGDEEEKKAEEDEDDLGVDEDDDEKDEDSEDEEDDDDEKPSRKPAPKKSTPSKPSPAKPSKPAAKSAKKKK